MKNDFTTTVIIKASPKAIFDALTLHIKDWWGNTDKPIQQKEDVFTVDWGESWYQFKVTYYKPNTVLEWECIDANQIIGDLEGVQKEWVGTTLHWNMEQIDETHTKLDFVHKGLVPEFICYNVCAPTWNVFIGKRLKEYLEKPQ